MLDYHQSVLTVASLVVLSAAAPSALAQKVTLRHDVGPYAVCFSSDPNIAITIGGGAIKLWDVKRGTAFDSVMTTGALALVALPDQQQLISAGGRENVTVKIWHLELLSLQKEIKVGENGISCLAATKDGSLLAVATFSNTVHLIDLKTYQTLAVLKGHKQGPNYATTSLAFSPDGKLLASAGGLERSIVVWDVAKRELLHRLVESDVGSFDSVAFSRDGKILATGAAVENAVLLWDARSGALQEKVLLNAFPVVARALAFSPTEDLLAIVGTGPNVLFWRPGRELQALHRRDARGGFNSLAFSHDGKFLITGSKDNTADIWEVRAP